MSLYSRPRPHRGAGTDVERRRRRARRSASPPMEAGAPHGRSLLRAPGSAMVLHAHPPFMPRGAADDPSASSPLPLDPASAATPDPAALAASRPPGAPIDGAAPPDAAPGGSGRAHPLNPTPL